MSFAVRGGVDKMSLHITPLNNYQLKEFSFTKFEEEILGNRQTYFVFMTYGNKPPENRERRFWIAMELDVSSIFNIGLYIQYSICKHFTLLV